MVAMVVEIVVMTFQVTAGVCLHPANPHEFAQKMVSHHIFPAREVQASFPY